MASPKPRFGGAHNMEPRCIIKSKNKLPNQTTKEMEQEGKAQISTSSGEKNKKIQNNKETKTISKMHSYEQKRSEAEGQHVVNEAELRAGFEQANSLKSRPPKENNTREGDDLVSSSESSCLLDGDVFQTCKARGDAFDVTEPSSVPEESGNEGKPILTRAAASESAPSESAQHNVSDLEKLLNLFENLGINAKPRPYTRRQCVTEEDTKQKADCDGKTPKLSLSSAIENKRHMSLDDNSAHVEGKSFGFQDFEIPGQHQDGDVIYCKNLFLKDRKGQFYLAVVPENEVIDLKKLKQQLNANRNLSFADEKALKSILKSKPGAVSPLAVMHEEAKDVRIALHGDLIDMAIYNTKLAFHPLDPLLQVDITYSQLKLFIESCGKSIEILSDESNNPTNSDFTLNGSQHTKSQTKKAKDIKGHLRSPGKDNKKDKRFSVKSTRKQDTILNNQQKGEEITVDYSDRSNPHQVDTAPVTVEVSAEEPLQKRPVSENVDLIVMNAQTFGEKHHESEEENHIKDGTVPGATEKHHESEEENHIKDGTVPGATEKHDESEEENHIKDGTVPGATEKHHESEEENHIKDGTVPGATEKHDESEEENHIEDGTVPGATETEALEENQKRFLRNPTSNMEDKSTVDSKMYMKYFPRKGKLKSFIKKSCNAEEQKLDKENIPKEVFPASDRQITDIVHRRSCESDSKDDDPFQEDNEEEEELNISFSSAILLKQGKAGSGSQKNIEMSGKKKIQIQRKPVRLMDIKQDELLPEVEDFYRSFEKLNVSYKEVELSCSNSKDIGASVGCRCFLLKDRRNNYYFIVTHEFYELDYGRLKQALKPKKKLCEVQPEEIMTVLGVDPMRMTPFAYPSARISNIRIFFTNKIRYSQLILCITHPFASGHRIVMKSSELQRYLECAGAEIEGVEEKAWAARYNTIFSQFETGTVQVPYSGAGISASQLVSSNTEVDTNLTADMEQGHDSSIDDAQQTDISGHRTMGSQVVTWLLEHTPIGYLAKNAHKQSTYLCTNGSSVDPSSWSTTSSDAPLSYTNPPHRKATQEMVKKPCKEESEEEDKDGMRYTQCETLDYFSSMKKMEDISTEEIEQHLQKYCVQYSLTKGTSSKADLDETVTKVKTNGNEGDIGRHDDDDISDDDEDVETCSLIYLKDDTGKTYVVLGGESEFITKRRFCRRFHINKTLTIWHHTFGSKGTNYFLPFSVAMLNDAAVTSHRMEMIVVLATCLYIDSSTVLRFILDEAGSCITMASEEFEKYARSAGFEVWYMP